jgi:hypothetical protein
MVGSGGVTGLRLGGGERGEEREGKERGKRGEKVNKEYVCGHTPSPHSDSIVIHHIKTGGVGTVRLGCKQEAVHLGELCRQNPADR